VRIAVGRRVVQSRRIDKAQSAFGLLVSIGHDVLLRYCSPVGLWRSPRGARPAGGHERDGAVIRALLLPLPPPGIIFAPGRGPAVLVGLQTADHIRLASPV
jgi:hypothetical protein